MPGCCSRSGETVQAGIAAGRTVFIPDDPDIQSIPYGAVGIARTANPNLSSILPRVSALVTEVGTSIGHLAAIAREMQGSRDIRCERELSRAYRMERGHRRCR